MTRTGRWLLVVGVTLGWIACRAGDGPVVESGDEPPAFDLVIANGRVIDPETGLDAVRQVGVRDGQVVAVTEEALTGRDMLSVDGLVVAPGFIDLHAHGQDLVSSRYQARDGVTSALELEIGVFPVDRWYTAREGQALIHYGASVSHQAARRRALGSIMARRNNAGTFTLGAADDDTLYRAASPAELESVAELMERGLDDGGLGYGFGLSYTPGATHEELLRLFSGAAARSAPVFVHLRSAGDFERGGAIAPFQEVVANVAATGVSAHIVHLNSSAGHQAEPVLDFLRGARRRGLDLTTEAYPYTASASLIESALFDGWVGRPDDSYGSLQWVETGERLSRETFDAYRAQGGWVIMHGRSETVNEWITAQPDVIAASDGIPFSEGRAHPRGAGTFARILGVYVRERGALSLMEALRKMTLLPAQRLEPVAAQMGRKGRIQVGSDADLTIFDPARVIDRATYDAPDRYSEGIEHVIVGGEFVVRDGALVEGVTPGRPIRGDDR